MKHFKRHSKKKNEKFHAKLRMLQHYGKQITNSDLVCMTKIYQQSINTVLLSKPSNRIRKAIIWYNNEAYPIIYDKIRKQIVTFLKPEYLTLNQQKIYNDFKNNMLIKNI